VDRCPDDRYGFVLESSQADTLHVQLGDSDTLPDNEQVDEYLQSDDEDEHEARCREDRESAARKTLLRQCGLHSTMDKVLKAGTGNDVNETVRTPKP
jgi:hypothetical protein